jgi:hypothetical protein
MNMDDVRAVGAAALGWASYGRIGPTGMRSVVAVKGHHVRVHLRLCSAVYNTVRKRYVGFEETGRGD